VAMAPQDSEFDKAAKWRISVSPIALGETLSNLFLKITYGGDVARFSSAGYLLDDNFFNGLPWMLGLQRFNQKIEAGDLELSILPLRKDAPIFMEARYWPTFRNTNQLVDLKSATLIPQYNFRVESTSK
jgi:beta-galactosidase